MLTPQSLHTMGSSLRPFLLMNSRGCHHPIGKEQDLTGLPIPSCPLPAFCLWENLAKDKFNQGSEKMQKQRKTVKQEGKSLSRVRLFATPQTIQSMEFSRSEYWSGQPFPSPGDLPNPGIEPRSPALQVDSLPAESPGKLENSQRDQTIILQPLSIVKVLQFLLKGNRKYSEPCSVNCFADAEIPIR